MYTFTISFVQLPDYQEEMKVFAYEKGTHSFCEHLFCKKYSALRVKKGVRSGHNINAWLFFLLWFYFSGLVLNDRAVFLIAELCGKNLVSQGTEFVHCLFF